MNELYVVRVEKDALLVSERRKVLAVQDQYGWWHELPEGTPAKKGDWLTREA